MARVKGHVVSTIKLESFKAFKLLVVQPVDEEGCNTEDSFLVVDKCRAGIGDHVLVLQEGNSIRSILGQKESSVEAVAVGVIDYVETRGIQKHLQKPSAKEET